MNWMNILKLDQVNIGSSTLDTRELPEEDDEKCCQEAEQKFRNWWDEWSIRMGFEKDEPRGYSYYIIYEKYGCQAFRHHLEDLAEETDSPLFGDAHKLQKVAAEILAEWDECER
tara:strand:- start:1438 stop:1779 length:342 start_codon:yes stop_codon:yes gene_type:complete